MITRCTLCDTETLYPHIFIFAGQLHESCSRCFDLVAEHEAASEAAVRELIQCAAERDYEVAVRP